MKASLGGSKTTIQSETTRKPDKIFLKWQFSGIVPQAVQNCTS